MDNSNITLPIDELERRFRSIAIRLPAIAGNEVVNFALDNFRRQGFLGSSLQPWRPRKNPNKWGQIPKRNGRNILVDTGRLRRSIRIVRMNMDEVVVGSDVTYAKANNDGKRVGEIQQVKEHTRKITTIARVANITTRRVTKKKVQTGTSIVKAHTRRINQNIPARKFLGESPYLTAKLQRVIGAEILKALNP